MERVVCWLRESIGSYSGCFFDEFILFARHRDHDRKRHFDQLAAQIMEAVDLKV